MHGSFKIQLINMGTRAAAFTAKIRCLYDYQLRLMHGVMPVPSGLDIANTIKYFSQTLLTVLKDVPASPLEMLRSPDNDHLRMALYPNLDYKGLYNALVQLLDVAGLVQYGLQAFGQSLLQCLGCILPFLEQDMIDNVPFLAASCMLSLPPTLHQEVINSLCFYILPFTITRHNEDGLESQACQSVSAVIMLVFQYSNNPAHHCQLLECLMALKQNVVKDLLCVIAYGTAASRASAAKLLFYYWPAFNANLFDRKGLLCKFASDLSPLPCQRDNCPSGGAAEASKICYDHCISITYASDCPPPLYLCIECANEIHREHPNQGFSDTLHPMQQVSMICENKNCRATDKSAVSICFSAECASYNGNHPIRYCLQCHCNRHNSRRGGDHIVHRSLPPAWQMDAEMQTYLVEAIVSLLKEARPLSFDANKECPDLKPLPASTPAADCISPEERQLLGRYGIWLLVGLCAPTADTPVETLGRLLSMLFHWFHVTAYTFEAGQTESAMEKLKTEHVCPWLADICKSHYKEFINCLLPHPPEYSRVGGHWDTLASRTSHLKDGLHRLFCLVPYEVITPEIWEQVMPHWMEAVSSDVPEKELPELKIVLSKILDPDMNPLGFDAHMMYRFVAVRFENTTAKVQQQALHWLQILSSLDVMIPLGQLFSMFGAGVSMMRQAATSAATDVESDAAVPAEDVEETEDAETHIYPVVEDESGDTSAISDEEGAAQSSRPTEFSTDAEHNLTCCILMLDILLKQMELQDVEQHAGISSSVCSDVSKLLKHMLEASWMSGHMCRTRSGGTSECAFCEASIMWHQLAASLVRFMAPEHPAHGPDPPLEIPADDLSRRSPPEGSGGQGSKQGDNRDDVIINMPVPVPDLHSVGGVLVHMPHVCSIMTATVETVSEQLDLAVIMPSEKVVCAIARSVTLSDADVATATVQVAKAQIVGEGEPQEDLLLDDDQDDFWHTSIGKFRFSLEDLPQPLQYIHQLLKELPNTEKPDILYYILQCLNVMVLHGDAFSKASKDHRGFFIWCQENLLIKNLWELCNAEHSHICQVCVPLLLHCVTLPPGLDVFWRVVQEDFHSTDWRVRFVAVERVTVITRFMDTTPLRSTLPLQAALANAFCYLVSSMDDDNVYVAQRATLYLGTIHDNAIKSLLYCLETQFDSVIVDRPMVLQSLYQLHNSLSDRHVLSWEFFLNRFDALFLEAQINLERAGDIAYLRDLRNSEINSEVFLHKLRRANDALSQSDGSGAGSVKTLSASFGPKWPYKRTMSAPASIIPRQDGKLEKEKIYNRQYSAPILKRKTSRFGIEGHLHSIGGPGDEAALTAFLHRAVILEESDRETIHLLVFLLIQFMSRSDQAIPDDEKPQSRAQQIVLRHLYLLLGYNTLDRVFYVAPTKLRCSAVFNVFLSNLPQLLDQNHLMGMSMLTFTVALMLFCPRPFAPVTDNTSSGEIPAHSLWHLEAPARRNWLVSLLVILYKYQYDEQPHCFQVSQLVRIVLNTLDRQFHVCRKLPATIVIDQKNQQMQSREASQPSLGTEGDHGSSHDSGVREGGRYETPPPSPMYPQTSTDPHTQLSIGSKGKALYQKSTPTMMTHCEEPELSKNRRSFETEDPESELMAIPENDVSDSTIHGSSAPGSFDEVGPLEESERGVAILVNNVQHAVCTTSEIRSQIAVHRATVVTQTVQNTFNSTIRMHDVLPECNGKESRPIGRQKRIVVPSITPASTPDLPEAHSGKGNRHADNEIASYASPDSPLSKMELMSITSAGEDPLSPHSVSQLEIPNQERLLPIGNHHKDGITYLVEKVREALGMTDDTQEDESQTNTVSDSNGKSLWSKNSFDKSEERRKMSSAPHSPRDSTSPRRLIKQVALESPPADLEGGTEEPRGLLRAPHGRDRRSHAGGRFDDQGPLGRSQRGHRMGAATITSGGSLPETSSRRGGYWSTKDSGEDVPCTSLPRQDSRPSSLRVGDECITDRCSECGVCREEYSDEELGLCIIILGTFIHREPTISAPYLPEILNIVSKVALHPIYPWQNESNIHLPGGATSVAHQFLRCVLHQLAPNGVFVQIFSQPPTNSDFCQDDEARRDFFRSIAQALLDFNELNPIGPLQLLVESLNSKKTLSMDSLPLILHNIVCYLDCLPLEAGLGGGLPGAASASWSALLTQLEMLFRRIVLHLNSMEHTGPLMRTMVAVLKIPGISQFKGILDPFSKILSYAIQNLVLDYQYLMDVCSLCYRGFSKERDKLLLCRMVVFELVQALKFKSSIPDSNLLLLVGFLLRDAGGLLPLDEAGVLQQADVHTASAFTVNVSDCMRQYMPDVLEFLADFHTLGKIKSSCKGANVGLNEDTLGGVLKGGVAQYLALEMTKGNSRDNRAVARYLPWLYNAPSGLQQGPKEFTECVAHMRLLSWLLLGSLTHSALCGGGASGEGRGLRLHGPGSHPAAQPVPQEASCHIADHVQVILAGFAEQSKASVVHMSSLFHAFILCQLWTMYLEQGAATAGPIGPPGAPGAQAEACGVTVSILFEFWGKVTPCILQLVSHTKVLAEMVNLHFLSLLEALLECRSSVLSKLLPLWTPVLYSQNMQLPGNLKMRLQACRDMAPNISVDDNYNSVMLKWLLKLQFKMSQIELQSSTATQFYSI